MEGDYGSNRMNRFNQKGKCNQIKRRYNDESSSGIRCFKCSSCSYIQLACANVLKNNKSYNTALGDDNICSSQLDSDVEEQEDDVAFYSQISYDNLLACVSSINCSNLDVVYESNRNRITGEKLQEMYKLLNAKYLNLHEEYVVLITVKKWLTEENERINAYCQKLEQELQLTFLKKKNCS